MLCLGAPGLGTPCMLWELRGERVNVADLVARVGFSAAGDVSQDCDTLGVSGDSSSVMRRDVVCQRVGVGEQRQLSRSVA